MISHSLYLVEILDNNVVRLVYSQIATSVTDAIVKSIRGILN